MDGRQVILSDCLVAFLGLCNIFFVCLVLVFCLTLLRYWISLGFYSGQLLMPKFIPLSVIATP